jgi:hypothetical protein
MDFGGEMELNFRDQEANGLVFAHERLKRVGGHLASQGNAGFQGNSQRDFLPLTRLSLAIRVGLLS